MLADHHVTRLVHEERRARFEGAARRHRLLRSLRRAAPVAAAVVPAPARVVGPAAPATVQPALVRPAPAATTGRTPGAAGRAA